MNKTRLAISILSLIFFGLAAFAAFVYTTTPANIRSPKSTHYHFRLQLLVDGQAVKFDEHPYQTPYDPNSCSAEITESPIHFHDNKDQFVHIHWKGVTGGQLFKHYGWNFIGGLPGTLGYKLE